jgi:alkanesulfonate monooxygenase SsuD/methylene tetrahydromethanopterin reductase-like flavin-dependent oxidoreductase (luciferase family)
MIGGRRLSFGIKTTPMHTTYEGIVSAWREADTIPEIEHIWLWDHMLPLAGDPAGPIFEGWTLLAALAAQTERVRLGLMVTALPLRPPAVLAKMAATVDLIAGGRLDFGIGVGATDRGDQPGQEVAVREYAAYGLPLVPPAEGIARLAEACTIVERMWTEDVFDFHGRYYQLTGARCAPKPVQRPHPPIMIGALGDRTLRVVAEHADIWNVPGPPWASVAEVRRKSGVLDRHCAAVGRDPGDIVRSAYVLAPADDDAGTRRTLTELAGAGMTHLVLGLFPPHGAEPIRRVVDEVIVPVRDRAAAG